jgi:hypothetical protein
LFKDLVEKFGEVEHKVEKTMLKNEVERYEYLKELLG